MPVRISSTSAAPPAPAPIDASQLPEEVYVELCFDNYQLAVNWCESVLSDLRQGVANREPSSHVVLWRPIAGGSEVYASVLTMRIVRALGGRYTSVRRLVSLAQLPAGLEMMIGDSSDQGAYRDAKV